MIKNFVLDTSILLHTPDAMINGFEDNNVVLTGVTLQELDSKKTAGGEKGYNAREACRILDRLREKGNLRKGVPLDNGGRLFVYPEIVREGIDPGWSLPSGLDASVPDNKIIATCLSIGYDPKFNTGEVILVTEDISMRVIASICGVKVQPYRNAMVADSGYTGHVDVDVTSWYIDDLYKNGEIAVPPQIAFYENQFVTLHCGTQSALSVHQNGTLRLVRPQTLFGNVRPLNSMQTYAMWALMQPAEKVPLVILSGPAGTAKTFLSLAAGLECTYTSQKHDGEYNRVMISRPTAQRYEGVGFLKGTLEEKLKPLLDCYYDNMQVLLSNASGGKEDRDQVAIQMDDMLESGVVEICGLDFIRGRSLQNTYLICDEAQNASAGVIRDVITRAGRGSKVIVAGDPQQIDSPALSKRSNGLVYAIESMKGDPLAAICTFTEECSVRSPLSKAAIKRMKI